MAYFNYFKYRLLLRQLLGLDFDRIIVSFKDSVCRIQYPSDYCEIASIIETSISTMCDFDLVSVWYRKTIGNVVEIALITDFDKLPF